MLTETWVFIFESVRGISPRICESSFQLILLLIGSRHFSHTITLDTDKTFGKSRHALQQLWKQTDRKAYYPTRHYSAAGDSELCHARERQHPGHFARRITCS